MAINKFGKAGFDSADKSFQGLGTLNSISQFTVFGCTDDTRFSYTAHPFTNAVQDYYSFFNFNPGANTDDGSCAPTVLGCLDTSNANYDASANANLDATPTLCEVLGCIDSTAYNYDPNANTDDGSCIPVILGCTDGRPDTNVAVYPNHSHPTSIAANLTINAYNGNPDNTDYSLYVNYDPTANTDDGSCIQRVYGCMQLNALMYNYDPLANTEPPGFCLLPILGCMDTVACNYDSAAQLDDGSCEYCSDNGPLININGADNYDGSTCSDTGGCQYCTYVDIQNSSTISYSNSVHLFWTMPTSLPSGADGSVAPVVSYEIRYRNIDVSGSSFITAVNNLPPSTTDYHISSLDPDTRYRFQIRTNCANTHSGPYSGVGYLGNPSIQKKTLPPSGCMDPNANNYNSIATIDDGSCVYVGCTDPLAFNPATGTAGKTEFTHPNGTIYYASIDDGSCIDAVYGCTNPAAGSLYNPLANIDNNSCPTGCMDSVATNYDSSAILHDDSCTYEGCTDPTASNYSFADSVVSAAGTVNLNTTNYGYGIIPGVPENNQYVSSASGLTETGTVTDNSSCTYDIVGCTNPNANNYFAAATTPCNLGDSDNDCCAFGSINSGAIGVRYNFTGLDPLVTPPVGTPDLGWVREGCMDSSFDNYNMTAAGANQTATVPIYSDPHVSLMNPGTSEGCLNFSTNPSTFDTIFSQGHSSFNNNLLEQTGGSNTAAGVPQQSHGIKFQLACNNSSGGCPDLNFGFVDPTAATTSTTASNDKLLVEIYNTTTGSRVVDFGDSFLLIHSDNSNGVYGLANAGPVDFWGVNVSTGYLVIPRSTAPSSTPTAIDFSNPTSGGAGQNISGQAAFNNTFVIPAKWLASKPRFLFEYADGTVKDDLIDNAQSGTYYSDTSGNVAFTQTLRITFKTGFGNIISGHDLDVKVGCTDPNAENYCPTCNAMQRFSQYEPNDPLSTTNWTICDYQP